MLTIGDQLPDFKLQSVVSITSLDKAFSEITNKTYSGKWLILFFWPKDFTFVCPTEIVKFGELNKEFQDRGAQVLGCSVDSEYVHFAWRTHDSMLRDIPFPMLSDIKRELSEAFGILDKNAGVSQRGTFIVNPEGVIKFAMVTDMKVGRNPHEVLRVLDALQTNELCGCEWKKGDKPLMK